MSEVKALNISGEKAKRSAREYSDTGRLLIYLGLTFTLTYIWYFIANPDRSTWEDMGQMRQSFVALGMMFPVISHVLTRVITKEGCKFGGEDNSYFGITFRDRKWVFFIAAGLIPWFYAELSSLIEIALSLVLGAALGLVISVAGYTLGRAYLYSTPAYAAAKFPFQILQTLVGSALALLLCWKCGVVRIYQKQFDEK